MFDIGIEKFGLLLVLALIIFGPDQLPRLLRQAAQTIRHMRRLANDLTGDLKAGLGPEYADLDVTERARSQHRTPNRKGRRRRGRGR